MEEQNNEQLESSSTKWWQLFPSFPWPIKKGAEIAFVVIVTILFSAVIASLPIPSPGMHITKPIDNTSFVIDHDKKMLTIDMNIVVDKGLLRYIDYDSEFLQRLSKKLSLAPSIWVMVHNHGLFDEWIPYEEVHDLGDESGSASVTLYGSNQNLTIALVSLNNNDAQYYRGYLAMLKEMNQFPRGKQLPENGVIKDKIIVRIINDTLRR